MTSIKALAITFLSLMLLAASPAQEIAPQPEKSSLLETSKNLTRNTTTGKEFEKLIKRSLEELGYQVTGQVQVGTRPNGGKHFIDLVAQRNDQSYLVSLKWQQSSGTAEQKVPYELICLSEALKQSRGTHQAAFLVLGGKGWSLKEFYLSGGLDRHLTLDQPVKLLSPEELIAWAKANQ